MYSHSSLWRHWSLTKNKTCVAWRWKMAIIVFWLLHIELMSKAEEYVWLSIIHEKIEGLEFYLQLHSCLILCAGVYGHLQMCFISYILQWRKLYWSMGYYSKCDPRVELFLVNHPCVALLLLLINSIACMVLCSYLEFWHHNIYIHDITAEWWCHRMFNIFMNEMNKISLLSRMWVNYSIFSQVFLYILER